MDSEVKLEWNVQECPRPGSIRAGWSGGPSGRRPTSGPGRPARRNWHIAGGCSSARSNAWGSADSHTCAASSPGAGTPCWRPASPWDRGTSHKSRRAPSAEARGGVWHRPGPLRRVSSGVFLSSRGLGRRRQEPQGSNRGFRIPSLLCLVSLPLWYFLLWLPYLVSLGHLKVISVHMGMRWLDGTTNSVDMNLNKLWEIVEDRGAWHATVHRVTKSWIWLSNWTKTITGPNWTPGPPECTWCASRAVHSGYYARSLTTSYQVLPILLPVYFSIHPLTFITDNIIPWHSLHLF